MIDIPFQSRHLKNENFEGAYRLKPHLLVIFRLSSLILKIKNLVY